MFFVIVDITKCKNRDLVARLTRKNARSERRFVCVWVKEITYLISMTSKCCPRVTKIVTITSSRGSFELFYSRSSLQGLFFDYSANSLACLNFLPMYICNMHTCVELKEHLFCLLQPPKLGGVSLCFTLLF